MPVALAELRLQRGDGAAAARARRRADRRARRRSLRRYSRRRAASIGGEGTSARLSRSISAPWPAQARARARRAAAGGVGDPRQPLAEQPRAVEPVAELAEIARAAAPRREPPERAADVGERAQRRAHALAQGADRRGSRRTRSSRASIAPRSISGAPRSAASSARARAGHRAVDRVEQAALALAGRRCRSVSRLSRVAASIAIVSPRRGEHAAGAGTAARPCAV